MLLIRSTFDSVLFKREIRQYCVRRKIFWVLSVKIERSCTSKRRYRGIVVLTFAALWFGAEVGQVYVCRSSIDNRPLVYTRLFSAIFIVKRNLETEHRLAGILTRREIITVYFIKAKPQKLLYSQIHILLTAVFPGPESLQPL